MTPMLLGSVMVPDVANPRPQDVDVEFMRTRLEQMRRFSGHPAALVVADHQRICRNLARRIGYGNAVVEWAEHHDDHEYATGDIPSPVQRAIGGDTIRALQERWDVAICGALGIAVPTDKVRRQVAVVDAAALVLEWCLCLGRDVSELDVSAGIVALADHHRAVMAGFV